MITLTIVEPFPVFFGHVSFPSERRRDTAKGPFYDAGLKRYHESREFAEWCAAGLREAGWTVSIAESRGGR